MPLQDSIETGLVDPIAERVAFKMAGRLEQFLRQTHVVQPALLTVKETAVYLGRSEQSIQHLIHGRDLPVVRCGRRVHLHKKDLDEWIEKNKA